MVWWGVALIVVQGPDPKAGDAIFRLPKSELPLPRGSAIGKREARAVNECV